MNKQLEEGVEKMKGIFRPIDYRIREQNTNHIHYGKTITILEDDGRMYCFAFDEFPNCNWKESKNKFWANHEEIEIIDHPTEKGGETDA